MRRSPVQSGLPPVGCDEIHSARLLKRVIDTPYDLAQVARWDRNTLTARLAATPRKQRVDISSRGIE
jgi:hypothetical protein